MSRLSKLWLNHYVYGDRKTAWFVVRNPFAGRKSVYIVLRIQLGDDHQAEVIGRELPLAVARAVVKKDAAR